MGDGIAQKPEHIKDRIDSAACMRKGWQRTEPVEAYWPGAREYCSKMAVASRIVTSHAKFCVSDGVAAYIGSANLTGPGLAGHIELGVLVRGPVARQVEELWLLCNQLGLFVEV